MVTPNEWHERMHHCHLWMIKYQCIWLDEQVRPHEGWRYCTSSMWHTIFIMRILALKSWYNGLFTFLKKISNSITKIKTEPSAIAVWNTLRQEPSFFAWSQLQQGRRKIVRVDCELQSLSWKMSFSPLGHRPC